MIFVFGCGRIIRGILISKTHLQSMQHKKQNIEVEYLSNCFGQLGSGYIILKHTRLDIAFVLFYKNKLFSSFPTCFSVFLNYVMYTDKRCY